jgi:hypothetical protein
LTGVLKLFLPARAGLRIKPAGQGLRDEVVERAIEDGGAPLRRLPSCVALGTRPDKPGDHDHLDASNLEGRKTPLPVADLRSGYAFPSIRYRQRSLIPTGCAPRILIVEPQAPRNTRLWDAFTGGLAPPKSFQNPVFAASKWTKSTPDNSYLARAFCTRHTRCAESRARSAQPDRKAISVKMHSRPLSTEDDHERARYPMADIETHPAWYLSKRGHI